MPVTVRVLSDEIKGPLRRLMFEYEQGGIVRQWGPHWCDVKRTAAEVQADVTASFQCRIDKKFRAETLEKIASGERVMANLTQTGS